MTSPRSDVEVNASKTDALADVLIERYGLAPRRILVVGCGDGLEAGLLARRFRADTVGIDVGSEFDFDHAGAAPARLCLMDARRLSFPDAAFDLIYSFHALEHIQGHERALAEMRRTLQPGGHYVIGTPNKNRVVGYIGSAAPLLDRVRWNLVDLRARLAGKWSNEAGAHAGFTRSELHSMCTSYFDASEDLTRSYYERLYSGRRRLLATLRRLHVDERLFPCVYMAGELPREAVPRCGANNSRVGDKGSRVE